MKIKGIWLKIKLRYLPRFCRQEDYRVYLQGKGVTVGEGTTFFDWKSNFIDTERAWMLSIGSYCKITRGVIILNHDYSRSVLRRVYGEVVGEAKDTSIGDNVFLGMNTIVLMGSHIGSNVIVGAGSVVTGDIPDNVVAAGSPAKVVCTLEEYWKKRKANYSEDARACARAYYNKYNKAPSIKEMNAFFPLYLKRNIEMLVKSGVKTNLSGDVESEIIEEFMKSQPIYSSYEAFLSAALEDENE